MRNAARFLDPHVCDHSVGIIEGPAKPTVLLLGLQAARFTDRAPCKGPPNALDEGAATVLVGRLPQARLGDRTAHGGSIAVGGATVLVGETPPGVKVVRRGNILLIVHEGAQRIVMVGVQEMAGTGGDAAYAQRAQDAINKAWSGTTVVDGKPYTVEALVTCRVRSDGDDDKNPSVNHIGVKQTSDPFHVTSQNDPSNQSPYGRKDGYQHSTDSDLCIAHEFGHAMGLGDEYAELPDPEDPTKRITVPWRAGDLMGDVTPGSKPTAQNFQSLITGKGLLP